MNKNMTNKNTAKNDVKNDTSTTDDSTSNFILSHLKYYLITYPYKIANFYSL